MTHKFYYSINALNLQRECVYLFKQVIFIHHVQYWLDSLLPLS